MPLPPAPNPFKVRFEDYVDQASENAGEPNACANNYHNLTSPIFVDPNNWEWTPKSRATWELAEEPWQEFRSKWYGAEPAANHSSTLSLEPLPLWDSISSILVRECYPKMFDNIWACGLSSQGDTGAIVTGQPGIGVYLPAYLQFRERLTMFEGKTLFQFYALVRLLQQKQVVLFLSRSGEELYLFYHDGVHTIPTASLKDSDLPIPSTLSSDVFIWSLFDIPERNEPNTLLVLPPCVPVQTTSPDPCRYKTWDKQRSPLFTALPLWTRNELAQGYVLPISSFSPQSQNTLSRLRYQERYQSLSDALQQMYQSSSQPQCDPLGSFTGVRALLDLKPEGTKLSSPEDCLNYLLDTAILRFGYAARDVFSAVFIPDATTLIHKQAFDITYECLKTAVSSLAINGTADSKISQRIIALTPVYSGPFAEARWRVHFKSDWVARCIVKKLAATERIALCQQINFFRHISQAGTMVGWFLEPLALRDITETSTGGSWTLINMVSNDADPPQFTVARDPSSRISEDVRFPKVRREVVEFQSIDDLSTCFENNTYYVPKGPNFPLSDAFVVDLDQLERSAVLWVLQVPKSPRNGSSAVGYQGIRNIIANIKRQLLEGSSGPSPRKARKVPGRRAASNPVVHVRYLLVVPEGDSKGAAWHFPKGWNENCKINDHRGEVYCLEIPLSVRFNIIENILSCI
jgi:hypothetical protein